MKKPACPWCGKDALEIQGAGEAVPVRAQIYRVVEINATCADCHQPVTLTVETTCVVTEHWSAIKRYGVPSEPSA